MWVCLKRLCDTCNHSSLPTSVLGLLEKKEEEREMMNDFVWVATSSWRKCFFEYLALLKHTYFGSKGFYQHGYYCRESLYMQSNQLETLIQLRKTSIFIETASETPYCKINHIVSQFWNFL